MIDSKDLKENIVHGNNEKDWREMFCDETGHTMKCIEETVDKMAVLLSKVCVIKNRDILEMISQIGVVKFDKGLKNILSVKTCKCDKCKTKKITH